MTIKVHRLGEVVYRASGDAICPVCEKPFKAHPLAEEEHNLSTDNHEPFLNRLCPTEVNPKGDLVKL